MSSSKVLFEEDSCAIFVVVNPARPFPHQLDVTSQGWQSISIYFNENLGMKVFNIYCLIWDTGYSELFSYICLPYLCTLEMPCFCRVVGNSGWMSCCHTPAYIPGLPSEAVLPGSRLPHCFPSAQQGLYDPHRGPAAHAVQPIYSSFAAMYLTISVT